MSSIPRPSSSPQHQQPTSNSIVLDALPYVEHPPPHYEQHAISLIEAELSADYDTTAEHPSLAGRLLPHCRADNDIKNAPLASVAYAQLAKGESLPPPIEWRHEHLSAISAAKIQYEHHRLHLANLDLHSTICDASRHQSHHSHLEKGYVIPAEEALREQKLRVDGINAARMEEQAVAMKTMEALRGRWGELMKKNFRLDGAIGRLEEEVRRLEAEAVVGDGKMEGGVDSMEH